jgi:hypothetical protein
VCSVNIGEKGKEIAVKKELVIVKGVKKISKKIHLAVDKSHPDFHPLFSHVDRWGFRHPKERLCRGDNIFQKRANMARNKKEMCDVVKWW